MTIVFRDHTLSDLIGFAYQSWNSRDAADDLLRRLREIGESRQIRETRSRRDEIPLVTIALDGENAWEYYPRDGRDFLNYLYERLAADSSIRCVTISEHLAESPAARPLGWLHTGSWIGGDLRTWSGDKAHNAAWELLHRARDLAAARRRRVAAGGDHTGDDELRVAPDPDDPWLHVLVAEGSDWFWWFGDHHHTELDYVWDQSFRQHLQAVYRALGEPVPVELLFPILERVPSPLPSEPLGSIIPTIDGRVDPSAEWRSAGYVHPDLPSTMQPSESTKIGEMRFGWKGSSLCLMLAPTQESSLGGLGLEIRLSEVAGDDVLLVYLSLEEGGRVEITVSEAADLAGPPEAAWNEVLEVSIPLRSAERAAQSALVVRAGRRGMVEHVYHATSLAVR